MVIDANRRLATTCILLAAIAAATLLSALAAPPASAAVPRSFYGVAPQTTLTPADYERMGRGKVGTLRIPIFWSIINPAAPAGDYDFSTIDPVVTQAASNGIEVLPFLYGTPSWVAEEIENRRCNDCSPFAPTSREGLAAWEDFVSAVVARYGRDGSFWVENPTIPKRPIGAWQIWNEQNSRTFFAPRNKPKLYAKLLDQASRAVKAEDRRAEIVLGGMPELAGSKKATPASRYLASFYRIRGVERDFDGVAIHPYGASLRKVADQAELFRDVIRRARDRKAELWVTELGAGSAKGGNPLNRGRSGQAKLLRQTFGYFKKQRNKLNIETVNWFSFMDSAVSICDWCASSGLFEQGLKPKPSWRAFVKFTGGR